MNLKEFSKLAGLSPTTISRALGGYPEVSLKTRRRVQELARIHHYQPNARAQGLATGRSKLIGFVIPQDEGFEFFSPIFADFIAGATTQYASLGYDTMIRIVDKDNATQAFRELKSSGKIDGIILQAPIRDDPRIEILKELEIPFIVHGRASSASQHAYVDVNNKRSFKNATELLLDLGHKDIALINGNEEMDFAWRRRQGFEEALQTREIAIREDWLFSAEMTEDFGYKTLAKLLCENHVPTALLISSLITAEGARRAIEERGLRIGQDISIITHDDDLSYFPNGSDVPLYTATRSSVSEAGRLCAQMLIEQIEHGIDHTQHHIFEAELIIGQSTGRRKG